MDLLYMSGENNFKFHSVTEAPITMWCVRETIWITVLMDQMSRDEFACDTGKESYSTVRRGIRNTSESAANAAVVCSKVLLLKLSNLHESWGVLKCALSSWLYWGAMFPCFFLPCEAASICGAWGRVMLFIMKSELAFRVWWMKVHSIRLQLFVRETSVLQQEQETQFRQLLEGELKKRKDFFFPPPLA